MNNLIKIGDKAINFTLKDQNGNKVNLESFRGKKVLLSWHPLAWTSVCLDHMRSLERNYDRFIEKNTIPLGISVDQEYSKSAWAKVINLDKLQILADYNPLGEVSKSYGAFIEDMNASGRVNVLVDEEGKVIWAKTYELSHVPDIEEVIDQL